MDGDENEVTHCGGCNCIYPSNSYKLCPNCGLPHDSTFGTSSKSSGKNYLPPLNIPPLPLPHTVMEKLSARWPLAVWIIAAAEVAEVMVLVVLR